MACWQLLSDDKIGRHDFHTNICYMCGRRNVYVSTETGDESIPSSIHLMRSNTDLSSDTITHSNDVIGDASLSRDVQSADNSLIQPSKSHNEISSINLKKTNIGSCFNLIALFFKIHIFLKKCFKQHSTGIHFFINCLKLYYCRTLTKLSLFASTVGLQTTFWTGCRRTAAAAVAALLVLQLLLLYYWPRLR